MPHTSLETVSYQWNEALGSVASNVAVGEGKATVVVVAAFTMSYSSFCGYSKPVKGSLKSSVS